MKIDKNLDENCMILKKRKNDEFGLILINIFNYILNIISSSFYNGIIFSLIKPKTTPVPRILTSQNSKLNTYLYFSKINIPILTGKKIVYTCSCSIRLTEHGILK